jgi:CYTH domain-containing protein
MAEEVENTQNVTVEQKSSVKVTRNSKGYTWEVKVYDQDPQKALVTLAEIETAMSERYGEKVAV